MNRNMNILTYLMALLVFGCGGNSPTEPNYLTAEDYDVVMTASTSVNGIPVNCQSTSYKGPRCDVRFTVVTRYSLSGQVRPNSSTMYTDSGYNIRPATIGLTNSEGIGEFSAQMSTAYSWWVKVCPTQGNGRCGQWELKAR